MPIINDPTVAAITYKRPAVGEKNVLIFNLGSDTFDVSLLSIEETLRLRPLVEIPILEVGTSTREWFLLLFGSSMGSIGTLFADQWPSGVERLRIACESSKRTLPSTLKSTIEIDLSSWCCPRWWIYPNFKGAEAAAGLFYGKEFCKNILPRAVHLLRPWYWAARVASLIYKVLQMLEKCYLCKSVSKMRFKIVNSILIKLIFYISEIPKTIFHYYYFMISIFKIK